MRGGTTGGLSVGMGGGRGRRYSFGTNGKQNGPEQISKICIEKNQIEVVKIAAKQTYSFMSLSSPLALLLFFLILNCLSKSKDDDIF